MGNMNILGNTIRQARMEKGITQEGLAELIDITPIHLKHIEGGQGNPSINVLFKLAKVLDFSVDSIIAEKDISENDGLAEVLKSNILYLLQKCTPAELRLIADIIKDIQKNRE